MNTLEEKPMTPMTPAEKWYANHLKNVATYQKKNPEKCKEKMKRYTESLKTDKEKNEREMARRKAYYNNVVKPQKQAIKQQKKDEMDKVKAEAKKCILEICEWNGEGNTPVDEIYIS